MCRPSRTSSILQFLYLLLSVILHHLTVSFRCYAVAELTVLCAVRAAADLYYDLKYLVIVLNGECLILLKGTQKQVLILKLTYFIVGSEIYNIYRK